MFWELQLNLRHEIRLRAQGKTVYVDVDVEAAL